MRGWIGRRGSWRRPRRDGVIGGEGQGRRGRREGPCGEGMSDGVYEICSMVKHLFGFIDGVRMGARKEVHTSDFSLSDV
jgi:hypothetical protein